MIIIEFYRFVATPQIVKTKSGYKNVFIKQLDHVENCDDSKCPFERARQIVHNWLKYHYGYCKIHTLGLSETDIPHSYRYCNHKKFKKELHKNGVEAFIK